MSLKTISEAVPGNSVICQVLQEMTQPDQAPKVVSTTLTDVEESDEGIEIRGCSTQCLQLRA